MIKFQRILELFNRDHNASTAKKSLQQCLNHFGDHVSADLIFGAPGQSLDEWLQDLDFVVREGVNHVSAYQLTVEKGTRLEKQESSAFLKIFLHCIDSI